MTQTKIYIKYIPRFKKAWKYASITVPETFEFLSDAQDSLEFGGKYNIHIDYLACEFGGLEDWTVTDIEQVANDVPAGLIYGDKSPHQREIEKLQRQTAYYNKKAEKEKLKAKELDEKIKEHENEQYNFLVTEWGLTDAEAKFALSKMSEYMKGYFKPTPQRIKFDYAKATKGEEEAKKLLSELHNEAQKELNAQSEDTGDYIKVLDKYVPYHLYYNYIVHLTKDVKSHELQSYENRRCILHQRLYDVFGLDRVHDRDTKESEAINRIVSKVRSCFICGYGTNNKDVCCKCGTQNNIGTYLNNLDKLKVKKEE
jgi:hypothetical protein